MRRTSGRTKIDAAHLKARLEEAESLKRAITSHQVDAFVVRKGAEDQILSLSGVDRPYRLLVDRMQQGAVTTSADGEILYCNRYFTTLTGRSTEDLLGKAFADCLAGNLDACKELLRRAAKEDGHSELTLRRSDGSEIPISVAACSLDGDEGTLCLVVTDLAPRHRAEAERAALLDDVRDLARASQDALPLQTDRLDLRALVSGVTDRRRPRLEESGRKFRAEVPPSELPVYGDLKRLTQMLERLLDNAERFSAPGDSIHLVAERAWESPNIALVRIQDSGRGISADDLPGVFDVFAGAPDPDAPNTLGIGLALARQLARLHGGTIDAFSAGPDQGAEFVVRLPMED